MIKKDPKFKIFSRSQHKIHVTGTYWCYNFEELPNNKINIYKCK